MYRSGIALAIVFGIAVTSCAKRDPSCADPPIELVEQMMDWGLRRTTRDLRGVQLPEFEDVCPANYLTREKPSLLWVTWRNRDIGTSHLLRYDPQSGLVRAAVDAEQVEFAERSQSSLDSAYIEWHLGEKRTELTFSFGHSSYWFEAECNSGQVELVKLLAADIS